MCDLKKFSDIYFDVLHGTYAGLNLTRNNERDSFYHKNIMDSVLPLKYCPHFRRALEQGIPIIDVGFGGGFPILPLAKLRTQNNFIGLEARKKKVLAVNEIKNYLNIKNVKLYHLRIENLLIDTPCVVLFKALGKCHSFLQRIKTSKKISVYFYKGGNFDELEKHDLGKILKVWRVIEERKYSLTSGDSRIFLGFANKKVPCGTLSNSKKNKELVNLSKIL